MKTFKQIDYETTGFGTYKGDVIFAYVITDEDCESRVYRFDNTSRRRNEVSEKVFEKFHLDSSIIKIAHNAKFEMGFTSQWFNGQLPDSQWLDTLIMSQMLNNLLRSHKLEVLAEKYLRDLDPDSADRWAFYDKEVKTHLTKQKRLLNNYPHRFQPEILDPLIMEGITPLVTDRPNYGLVPRDIMTEYQIGDGERNMLLHKIFYPEIIKDKRFHEDFKNEMRLLVTAQKMEQRGMMIHTRESEDLIDALKYDLDKIEIKKKKIFGFDINLNSTDHLQKHLFGYINPKKHDNLNEEWKKVSPRFGMSPISLTKGNAPCTAKDDIILLQKNHPKNKALELLLKYRTYSKGVTMIESYIENAGDDLIIHPNMNTNQAKTGRQSVSNPSLQNVAKGETERNKFFIPARQCFRPRPGYVYFLGDYAGIEMRLIIAASGEEYLIDQLNKDMDYDVHTYAANIIYENAFTKNPDPKKKKFMRADVKNGTFGIGYGANFATWCKALRLSSSDGRAALDRYKEKCPGICGFTQNKIKEVKRNGFITSAFGRKLFIESSKAYTASNYQIQGDAAGVLKRAQNNVDDYIMDVWNSDYDLLSQILTVHDEDIIEMHRSLLPMKNEILHDLSFCMTNMKEIVVPLAAEWKMTTTNWHAAQGIEI